MEAFVAALMIGVLFFLIIWYFGREAEEAKRGYASLLRAEGDPKIVCPHCHQSGCVTTRKIVEKSGIDGGKATAAVLTGGLSLVATGLSGNQERTEATCSNCHTVWRF